MRWLTLAAVLVLLACTPTPFGTAVTATPIPHAVPVAPALSTPSVQPTPQPTATRTPPSMQPFTATSVQSGFAIAATITGTYHLQQHELIINVSEATIVHRDSAAYTGRRKLIGMNVSLMRGAIGKDASVVTESRSVALDRTTRPGDTITVTDLLFRITLAPAPDLSRSWLMFNIAEDALDGPSENERRGWASIPSAPNIFQP